ncbi:TPA: hypothetical protein DCE37_16950 [Candidatus Latescibacteria bacterium]|nr:hypothetical protein [Candidatus Latescibacterota bacterium]
MLSVPSAVFVDGNITIADTSNDRVRRIVPNGTIDTIAGTGERASSGNNVPATDASVSTPTTLFVDGSGNTYTAKWTGHRVRRITPAGITSTVGGTGQHGFGGDGTAATEIPTWSPSAIYLESDSALYLAEWGNHRIRKVGADGIVKSLAGTGLSRFATDESLATSARITNPNGIFVDSDGTVYSYELGNHLLHRITRDGRLQTVAGTVRSGFSGDDGTATLAEIHNTGAIFIDGAGTVFFIDVGNAHIRSIDQGGTIRTLIGVGIASDQSTPTGLALEGPTSIFVDKSGEQYVADGSDNRIRRFSGIASLTFFLAAQPKSADFDGDGRISFRDFLLFIDAFGSNDQNPAPMPGSICSKMARSTSQIFDVLPGDSGSDDENQHKPSGRERAKASLQRCSQPRSHLQGRGQRVRGHRRTVHGSGEGQTPHHGIDARSAQSQRPSGSPDRPGRLAEGEGPRARTKCNHFHL